MKTGRLLFASIHSYLDPSSGAALATRELLELLAARGWDCRALTCGILDYQRETSVDELLRSSSSRAPPVGSTPRWARRSGGGGRPRGNGVRVTLMPTASSRAERAPEPAGRREVPRPGRAGARPVPARRAVDLRRARRQPGADAAGPRRRHARSCSTCTTSATTTGGGSPTPRPCCSPPSIPAATTSAGWGWTGPSIPYPVRLDRVIAEDPDPTYVTFVNPQPEKGAAVFARIALELGRRRPEIPLLVVEGRGTSDGLASVPLDLSGLTNLNRMANTPDPRDFYRVSRVVLMPSLWRESLGRVAVEAMANGIPVLASDRGALPETLGDAGFVLTIPERYTPSGPAVPGPREGGAVGRDRRTALGRSGVRGPSIGRGAGRGRRWDADRLVELYEAFFRSVRSLT